MEARNPKSYSPVNGLLRWRIQNNNMVDDVPRGSEWISISIKRSVYEELRKRAGDKSVSDFLLEVLGGVVHSVGGIHLEAGDINSPVNGVVVMDNLVCRHRGNGVSYCVDYVKLSEAIEVVNKQNISPFELEEKCKQGKCSEHEALVYEAFSKGLVVYSPVGGGFRVLT